MPFPTTISIEKLSRLVGTSNCPALIDVRTEEDFAADPRLIPGSVRRPHAQLEDWATRLGRSSAIVICHQGKARRRRRRLAAPSRPRGGDAGGRP